MSSLRRAIDIAYSGSWDYVPNDSVRLLNGICQGSYCLRFVEPLKEALVYVKRHLHRGNSVCGLAAQVVGLA